MKLGAVPPVVPAAPGIEPGTAGLPESGFTPGTGYDPGAGFRRISTRVPTSVAPPLALAPASRSRAYSSISLASAGCPATLPSSSTAKADGDERWRSTRSSASARDVRSRRWMPAAARAQSSGSAPRCTARTSSSTQYFSLRSNASLLITGGWAWVGRSGWSAASASAGGNLKKVGFVGRVGHASHGMTAVHAVPVSSDGAILT